MQAKKRKRDIADEALKAFRVIVRKNEKKIENLQEIIGIYQGSSSTTSENLELIKALAMQAAFEDEEWKKGLMVNQNIEDRKQEDTSNQKKKKVWVCGTPGTIKKTLNLNHSTTKTETCDCGNKRHFLQSNEGGGLDPYYCYECYECQNPTRDTDCPSDCPPNSPHDIGCVDSQETLSPPESDDEEKKRSP